MVFAFAQPLKLAATFDPPRAARTLAELEALVSAPDLAPFAALIGSAAGNSPYLSRLMLKDSAWLARLLATGPHAALAALEAEALAVGGETDSAAAMRRLRLAKRRAALAIALADLAGIFDLDSVTAALTRFADCAVKGALRFLLAAAARQAGESHATPEGLEQSTGLIILAMGKMGAFELNYSSDIDLIVFYDEDRFPFARGGEKRTAAVDLVKGLIRLLAEPT